MIGQPVKRTVSPEETQHLWERHSGIEPFLSELRSRGAYQVESIMAVRQMAGLSLGEAKEVVHFSQTWADKRESSEVLHESIFEALDVLQREEHADLAEHVVS